MLPATNKKFAGYKIESVCIQTERRHRMKLQLVADNDNGESYLFKIRLRFLNCLNQILLHDCFDS